jgi:hypothetical protein
MLMENVASNPCVGCGPSNPAGMRLVFEATDDGAATRFVAEPRWQGFPGYLHSAILYMALLETLNWSLYARTQRMGLPSRTSALAAKRRVRVGDAVVVEGRVTTVEDGFASVAAAARTPSGEPIGSLERDYRLVSEDEFLRVMGYETVPEGYEGAFG